MLQGSEFRSTATFKLGIFIVGVNHTVENISLFLLIKRKYQIPSKIPKNISESFTAFPWSLQTSAEILP